jgi:hypothetical protein
MKHLAFLALVAVALLSGCVAYPAGSSQGAGQRGYFHDGDRHGDDRQGAGR